MKFTIPKYAWFEEELVMNGKRVWRRVVKRKIEGDS